MISRSNICPRREKRKKEVGKKVAHCVLSSYFVCKIVFLKKIITKYKIIHKRNVRWSASNSLLSCFVCMF